MMTKEGVCPNEKNAPKDNFKTAYAKMAEARAELADAKAKLVDAKIKARSEAARASCGEDTLSKLADAARDAAIDDNHT